MSEPATIDATATDASTVDAPGTTTTADTSTATDTGTGGTMFSEGLNFAPGWQEHTGDSAMDPHQALAAQFKSMPAVFDALKENMTAARAKTDGMVKIPGEAATDEDRAAYRTAIGVPETPDAYEEVIPDILPEGEQITAEELGPYKQKAHELGLTTEQFNGILQFQIEQEGHAIQADIQAQSVQEAQTKQELQTEFGNRYDERMLTAQRAAATVGIDPEAVKTDPSLARAMARVADLTGPDQLIPGDQVVGSLSAGSQARDIMTNKANPKYEAYHNGDKAVVDEVMGMLKNGG